MQIGATAYATVGQSGLSDVHGCWTHIERVIRGEAMLYAQFLQWSIMEFGPVSGAFVCASLTDADALAASFRSRQTLLAGTAPAT